jgi:predicted  nucleic acid-binding Zn-ribbon protein
MNEKGEEERRMNHEEKILEILVAMQQDMAEVKDRIGGLEGRIGGLEGRIGGLEGRIGGLEGRMDRLEEKVDELAEAHEETRAGVNSLLDWAEQCGNVIKFPLPKVK